MAENTIGAPQEDITQQATAPTPKKKPATEKNPKRVAAGKMVAERTRRARESQKKAAEEGAAIIANQTPNAKGGAAEEPTHAKGVASDPPEKPNYSSLTTTQWLALGSLIVSLIGLYYRREEIKKAFSTPQVTPQMPAPTPPPASQTPYDRPVISRSLRNMD